MFGTVRQVVMLQKHNASLYVVKQIHILFGHFRSPSRFTGIIHIAEALKALYKQYQEFSNGKQKLCNTIKKSTQRALRSIYILTITTDIKRIRRVQGSGLAPEDSF